MTDGAKLSVSELIAMGMPRNVAYALQDMYVKTGGGTRTFSTTNIEQIIQFIADRSSEIDKLRRQIKELESRHSMQSDIDKLRRDMKIVVSLLQLQRPDVRKKETISPESKTSVDKLRIKIEQLEKKVWL